jgi:hypothetical protein
LHREQIHAEFLPYTSSYKHVWARDYMPIQIEKTMVFYFEYWPDYLQGYDGYVPNVLEIIDHLHLGRIPVDFILDGGNFVKCGDKVIMTDKIFKENDWMERKELLATLEDYLQVQIVIIPWDRYEIFGHSDGMVQWIEGNRVLMNNYINTDPNFRKKLLEALTPHFVVDELEFNAPRLNKLSWAYLNFLRVKNTIFVPVLTQNDMNLRDIKKDIAYILEAFIEDCTTVATVNSKVDEKAAELFEEAVGLYNELMDKVSVKTIEGSKKAYYTALRKELLEKTDALYSKLSDAVKDSLAK